MEGGREKRGWKERKEVKDGWKREMKEGRKEKDKVIGKRPLVIYGALSTSSVSKSRAKRMFMLHLSAL